jgi:uncharacterized membrane protein
MKEQKRMPDRVAGIFAVIFGAICLVLAIFVSTYAGERLMGLVFGLMLLGWGSRQLVAARKRKD